MSWALYSIGPEPQLGRTRQEVNWVGPAKSLGRASGVSRRLRRCNEPRALSRRSGEGPRPGPCKGR